MPLFALVTAPRCRYPALIIWPSAFTLSVEDGVVGIVDATGRVVARVGDQVQFSAFDLSYRQAIEHGGLDEITPACSSPYWAVGEEFTAAQAQEAPMTRGPMKGTRLTRIAIAVVSAIALLFFAPVLQLPVYLAG